MRHLLRRTAGALLALFVIAAFAAPHALGALSRPAVEKPPSPEAVNEWESAVFIARANGAAFFAWRIVSSDGTALYDAAAAPEYFPGLRVQGADTDTLTLLDIPSSLNGWQVECLFTDDAGEKALSGRASLTVYPVGPTGVAEPSAHAGRDSHPGAGLRRRRSLLRRSRPRSPRPRPLPRRKRPCRRQLPPPPRPRRFRAARCSVCLPVSLRSRSFSARSL